MTAETELRLAIRVTNPQALQNLDRLQQQFGQSGVRGFENLKKSAMDAGQEIERIGQFGKFSVQVLQAFLLYRGFVFLKDQAVAFTQELVEMEHQISLTQTQLNTLGRDFRPIVSQEVKRTAMETGIAFSELAQTEFEIVSANTQVADSFRVLNLIAKASVAGGLRDASLAFDAALTQLNAFELPLSSIERLLDRQFNLIKRGIFTYEQYARVSGEIAIAFGQIDQNVEVANAALATISQIFTGPQLREGATGLKNAALALIENQTAFEEFGLALHDEEGNFRNFIDIVNDLKASLENLTPRERAAVLHDLFDEKRARRGIEVLLRETETLNQFYVEQQFALGDLDDAIRTMNEDLLTQANIFRNELIPAAEPFVALLRDSLVVIRGLGNAVGGTQNLAVMLMAIGGGAALGAAARYKGLQTHTLPAGSVIPLAGGGWTLQHGNLTGMGAGIGRPTWPTYGAAGIGGLLAFEGARQPGDVDFMKAFTTVGGATLGGAMFGGMPGALAFGGFAAAGLIIGEALQEQAPPVAKSFSEAFREALVEESSDIAKAFTQAVTESSRGDATGFGRLFQPSVLYGGSVTLSRDRTLLERLGYVLAGGAQGPGNPFPEGGFGTAQTTRRLTGLRELVESGAVSGIIQSAQQAYRLAQQTESAFHVDPDEARAIALRSGVERAIPEDVRAYSQDSARALETFVTAMAEANLGLDQQREALDILTRGLEAGESNVNAFRESMVEFSDYLRQTQETTVSQYGSLVIQFESLATTGIDPLISIFEELGEEGEALVDSFREIDETIQRFKRFQDVLGLQFAVQQQRQLAQRTPDLRGDMLGSDRVVTEEVQRGFLDIVNERFQNAPITREELAQRFYDELRDNITVAFSQRFPNMSREDAIQFIVGGGPETPAALVVPAATSLADALEEAQYAVEEGLIGGLGYTSDQLEDLAGTFEVFNRQVFKIGIVQELQRLAEIAHFGGAGLQPVLEEMIGNIELAGVTFQEVLADPRRLADLLAELKFGDVSIDQSQQNFFTIRVEAAMDTTAIVRTADDLMKEINRRTNEARRG